MIAAKTAVPAAMTALTSALTWESDGERALSRLEKLVPDPTRKLVRDGNRAAERRACSRDVLVGDPSGEVFVQAIPVDRSTELAE